MSNEQQMTAHPELESLQTGRWKAIRELSDSVETGGMGRSVPAVETAAIEADLKAFTPEERTGFISMRNIDLRRIMEDLNETSGRTEGKTKEYPNEEGDTLRIEWNNNEIRLISEWNDGEGGKKQTFDPEEIARHHDMLSLISVYRDAQKTLENAIERKGSEQ